MPAPLQRALLTGVTGFVGAHMARRLVERGVEVHAIVRPSARTDRIGDLLGAMTMHVDDGTSGCIAAAVAGASPDATFHLATNFVAQHGPDDVTALVVDNVAFPARLADALANAGAAPFVNVGTAWQHVEGARYRPKNLYAATKQAFEDVLRYYTDRGLLRVVTVNIYDSYGPLDHRNKLLTQLLRAVRTGEALDMSGGVQLVDLVHVDDITNALWLAAALVRDADRSTWSGDSAPFALSSGHPRTLRELVAVIGEVAGTPVQVRWGARPDREGDMTEPWAAGEPVPGWSPTIDLETGLARLLRDEA
jgi:nucleoside-diphosphate-sugar epimerase